MEKEEAAIRILSMIDKVKDAGPFKGRTALLKKLERLQNLIVLYKPTTNYYELIVNEAELDISQRQEGLNNGETSDSS